MFGNSVANYLNTSLPHLEMFGDIKLLLVVVQDIFKRLDFIVYLNLCYNHLVNKVALDIRINVIRILCWIHFKKNVIKKTKTLITDKKFQIDFNLFMNIL